MSDKDTDQALKHKGRQTSATPSIDLLNRKLGPSVAPRMLTPYEIDLLRQSKVEVDRVVGEILANKDKDSQIPGSVFDPKFIVLNISGKYVSLLATLKLMAALRGLLMRECADQPPPEWFSGHRSDGTPSAEPHLALIPLPSVGTQHADGRIAGLGLVLPADLDPLAAGRYLDPFLYERATGSRREHPLFNGRWFECTVEVEPREQAQKITHPTDWTRNSRVWASVTPVVLNRHFNGKDKWERAADSVKDACQHIGLPRPREVLLHPVSLVENVPHARDYPQLTRKNAGGAQSHSHAVIIFDAPVRGPVLVGAGRFRGYGLCRPIDGRGFSVPCTLDQSGHKKSEPHG